MSNDNERDNPPPPEGMPPEGSPTPLDSGKPAVAAAPGKMMLVLLAAAIFLIIIIKSVFFSSGGPPPKPEKHAKEHVNTASVTPEVPLAPPPPPPPPEKQEILPPAPPPPEMPKTPDFKASAAPTNEALKTRIRAPMMVASGGAHLGTGETKKKKGVPGSDENATFAESLEGTTADRVEATTIGNLNATIVQGKLIHAVLESAINSTLPAPIRAIVSHDIYGESGRTVLIPKGSRLIGVYNTSIKKGQARVYVMWTRVIRPDGIDVAINSPGVDALGRGGVPAYLDNKFFEMFGDALLTSVLDIGTAVGGAALIPNGNSGQTSTTNSNGTTTTTTPSAQAVQSGVQSAVSNMSGVGQAIVGSTASLQPVLTIDQGTLVNVFVNKDVVFPSEASRFVQ